VSTILITGTSRGIGNATANRFLNAGWTVIGTSTSDTSLIGHQNYRHIKLDLSNEGEIAQLVQSLKGTPLDCILNNAGIHLEDQKGGRINFKQLAATLQINLIGPMNLTEGLLDQLKDGGRVINISSNWGSFSDSSFDAHQPHYKISKAALNMYTKLLASRRPDITVLAFDPGWVKTDMGGEEATQDPDDVAQDLLWLANTTAITGRFYAGRKEREW